MFENYTASFEIDKRRIELNMWDTSGSQVPRGHPDFQGLHFHPSLRLQVSPAQPTHPILGEKKINPTLKARKTEADLVETQKPCPEEESPVSAGLCLRGKVGKEWLPSGRCFFGDGTGFRKDIYNFFGR